MDQSLSDEIDLMILAKDKIRDRSDLGLQAMMHYLHYLDITITEEEILMHVIRLIANSVDINFIIKREPVLVQ